jgi:ubiquinol-cytochrome c reductase cytochrome b subunit
VTPPEARTRLGRVRIALNTRFRRDLASPPAPADTEKHKALGP